MLIIDLHLMITFWDLVYNLSTICNILLTTDTWRHAQTQAKTSSPFHLCSRWYKWSYVYKLIDLNASNFISRLIFNSPNEPDGFLQKLIWGELHVFLSALFYWCFIKKPKRTPSNPRMNRLHLMRLGVMQVCKCFSLKAFCFTTNSSNLAKSLDGSMYCKTHPSMFV